MQFTQNPAVSEPRPGGRYQLYGGLIDGEYLNLTEAKSLELKWRFKDWGDAGYSHVLISFEEDEEDVRAMRTLSCRKFL